MGLFITAKIKDNSNNIVGYNFIDSLRGSSVQVPLNNLKNMFSSQQVMNAEYRGDTIYGLNGTDLTNLPTILKSGKVEGKNASLLMNVVVKNDEDIVGVTISDCRGLVKSITLDDFYRYIEKSTVHINYKMKDIDGVRVPVATMEKTVVVEQTEALKSNSYNSGLGEKKAEFHEEIESDARPVYSMEKVVASEFNADAQTKITMAKSHLKLLSIYYWLMLNTIPLKPCDNKLTPTLGASEDTIYYNVEFVSKIPVSELVFILMHELCHIGMQHTVRRGKRDRRLWNVATDLYINEQLLREFDLQIGKEKEVSFEFGSDKKTIAVKAPAEGCYMKMVGEVIDLAKDIPEILYNRLNVNKQDNDDNGQNSQQNGNNNNNSDNNSGSSSGGGQNNQQNEDNNSGSGSGSGQDEDNNANNSSGSGSSGNNEDSKGTVTYNGKKIGDSFDEILSEEGTITDTQKAKSLERSRNKISTMRTAVQVEENKTGKSLSAGTGLEELLLRYIEFGLSNNVDWRKVLAKMCKYVQKKIYSLSSPNIDYMNMGVTLASRVKAGKKKNIENIKICIDVSGSIDDTTLQWYLSEVANIFSHYKVTGELIYWSTDVGDSASFQTVEGLTIAKPHSTGGTDISCLFEYLIGKTETYTGKREKDRVKDMAGVIILTDGCFAQNYEQYADYFSKKTLFIIDGSAVTFSPCFGQVVELGEKPNKK